MHMIIYAYDHVAATNILLFNDIVHLPVVMIDYLLVMI